MRLFERLETRQMLSGNPGDFNGDFIVDDADIAAVAEQYNLPQSAVDAVREWHANYGAQYFDSARSPITMPMGDVIPAIGDGGDAVIGDVSGVYDKLIVPAGFTATVRGELEVKELRVEGTLILDPAQDTRVEANTILVLGSLVSEPDLGIEHAVGLGGEAPQDAQQITQGMIVLGDLHLQGERVPGPIGDDPDTWDDSRSITLYSQSPEHRAHVMVMGPANYHVDSVRFESVGRTTSDPLDAEANHIGRYAFHLHHSKVGGTFANNVVLDPAKWGVAVHFTQDARIVGNTILGATGAGISFEAGQETNNSVFGNYIGNIEGNGESPYSRPASEGGFAGDGIWLRGAGKGNFVENNVIVNVSGSGIAFFARFGNEADIQSAQMGSLRGNSVKNADVGYSFYGVGEDYKIGNGEYFNARGLRAENVRLGVETSYVGPMDFSESHFTGRGEGIGIKAGSPEWMLLEDVTITGFGAGVQSQSGFTVHDGYYDNGTNLQYTGAVVGRQEGHGNAWLRHEDVLIYQPTFGPNSNVNISLPPLESPQRFRNYLWQQNVVYVDDDGVRHLLYREGQGADATPPEVFDSRTGIEPGLTNQELFDRYRMAYFGRIRPEDAEYTTDLGWHAPAPEDIMPPLAYDTRTERLADGRLAIRWKTDEPATSQVEWAAGQLKTNEWGNFSTLDDALKTEHEVIIDAPVGRVAFMRYSADAMGNLNQQYRHGGFDRRAFSHAD